MKRRKRMGEVDGYVYIGFLRAPHGIWLLDAEDTPNAIICLAPDTKKTKHINPNYVLILGIINRASSAAQSYRVMF